jgi:penicillin-binding protein 1A
VDAWFAGYHPTLSAAVWVGYDTPRSLGDRESGGRLALPIWTDFMGAALKGTPVAPMAEPPAGLARIDGDWLYSEWQSGGWISQVSDTAGTRFAAPPEAPAPLPMEGEPLRPRTLLELLQGIGFR